LIKIIIKEENFKWHLKAFASELFKYSKSNDWGVIGGLLIIVVSGRV